MDKNVFLTRYLASPNVIPSTYESNSLISIPLPFLIILFLLSEEII